MTSIKALVTWFIWVRRRAAAASYLRVLSGEMTARGWSCSLAASAVPILWITPATRGERSIGYGVTAVVINDHATVLSRDMEELCSCGDPAKVADTLSERLGTTRL
ncbi:hypothetical protein [Actinomadura flavalba]|uniref:hypothetical protein n=1 Tax=Actinomadura flavalba TaxID=1120938 RepID=UPI000360D662|nr:hypothetical protein [Actinomadura flavalba]